MGGNSQRALVEGIFRNSHVPLLAADASSRIVEISEAAARLFGYTRDELIDAPLATLIPPSLRVHHASYVRNFGHRPENNVPMGRRGSITGHHKSGERIPLAASISKFMHGERQIFVATLRDMRAARLAEHELEWRATHDPLTGLPNRALILKRLDEAIKAASRTGGQVGLLFVDLDGFKLVNDAYGHAAGDELLAKMASLLRALVRPTDVVGRLSGDEFIIVCEDFADPAEISSVADRIIEALARPFSLSAAEIFQNCSIGIAFCGEGDQPETVIANADAAMYLAKKSGRSNWQLFNPALDYQARRRLLLANGLRSAVARQELHPVLQPIVDATSRTTRGFELLMRWRHDGEEVSPAEFIPIAERTGTIGQIGEWAFRQGCQLRAKLTGQFGPEAPYVSVNLSVRQLQDSRLAERFRGIATEEGADTGGILIEITESVLMTETDRTAEVVCELARLGFKIAIDDFGTGYSSLAQIFRFPVNVIKVDRELVRNLVEDQGSWIITDAIRSIAAASGKALILEGVESAEQWQALEAMGCSLVQGYLFSRPLPGKAVPDFLTTYPPEAGRPKA